MDLWSTFIWRSVVPSSPVCRQWRFHLLVL